MSCSSQRDFAGRFPSCDVGSQGLEGLNMLLQLFLNDLSILLGQLVHAHAFHKPYHQIHRTIFLKGRHKCGQRYLGPFAQILLDGNVGTKSLEQGSRRRHDHGHC